MNKRMKLWLFFYSTFTKIIELKCLFDCVRQAQELLVRIIFVLDSDVGRLFFCVHAVSRN